MLLFTIIKLFYIKIVINLKFHSYNELIQLQGREKTNDNDQHK